MKIKEPKFEIYELVTLYWDGEHRAKVVRRLFDANDGTWVYLLAGAAAVNEEKLYPEQAIDRAPAAVEAAQ